MANEVNPLASIINNASNKKPKTDSDNHYARFTAISEDSKGNVDENTKIVFEGKEISTADGWRIMTTRLGTTDGKVLGKIMLQMFEVAWKAKLAESNQPTEKTAKAKA